MDGLKDRETGPQKSPDQKSASGPWWSRSARQSPSSAWWKPAVAVFGEVTGWIVVPIIGALYLGQYLDERQGTGSLYFLSLTGLAFVISCTGIAIVGSKYIKQMESEKKNSDEHGRNDK